MTIKAVVWPGVIRHVSRSYIDEEAEEDDEMWVNPLRQRRFLLTLCREEEDHEEEADKAFIDDRDEE